VFLQLRSQPVGAIVVSLKLQIGGVAEFAVPTPQEIAARDVLCSVHIPLVGRRVVGDADLLPNMSV